MAAHIQIRIAPALADEFKDACSTGRKTTQAEIIRSYCIEPYVAFVAAHGRQPHSLAEFAAWILKKS